MTNTYDPGTVIGKARLMGMDRGPTGWRYSDEEVSAFLSLSDDDPRIAAALMLEDTANNQALLTKVKKVGEIELTSGVDIAKVLMNMAAGLRESVESGSAFAVI